MKIDVTVSQLLVSRLCHDLVGPAGAVSAGLELMAESGGGADAGAQALVEKSAGQLSARLAFFRVAFGFAGAGNGPEALRAVREIALEWLAGGKIELEWPEGEADDIATGLMGGGEKVLLNMILVASESLPKGGVIGVQLGALAEGTGIAVSACGDSVGLKEDLIRSMSKDIGVEELSAHNVHGYFAQCLARQCGGSIEVEQTGAEEVRLAVLISGTQA